MSGGKTFVGKVKRARKDFASLALSKITLLQ